MATKKTSGTSKATTNTTRSTRTTEETAQAMAKVVEARKSAPSLSATEAGVDKARKSAAVQSTAALTVDATMTNITNMVLTTQKTLQSLGDELTTKIQERDQLDEAIKAKREELEGLHGVDVLAASIDDLIQKYEDKKRELDKSLADAALQVTDKTVALRREFDQMRQELEQARKREQDDYTYKTNTTRMKDEQNWATKLADQERNNKLTLEALQRDWDKREAELRAREAEYKELTEFKANYSALLKKEIDAAVAIATNSLNKELSHSFALEKAALQSQLDLERQASLGISSENKRLSVQIVDLQSQLSESNRRIEAIATKAVESAGSTQAFHQVALFNKQTDTNTPTGRKS